MRDVVATLIAIFGPIAGLWLRSRLKQQDRALQEIHVLVNGNLQEALRKIQTLTQAIADASPKDFAKAQAALVADGVVERKDAAIEALNAYPAQPDKPKGS